MKIDPDVFERHGNVGVILEERSVEERAKYHFYLAKLYAKDGRNDLALQYLRKCLEEGFKEKKKLEDEGDFADLARTARIQGAPGQGTACSLARRSGSAWSGLRIAVRVLAVSGGREPGIQRLAILRFENLTPDPATDWMGRAFSEVITAELAGATDVYAIPSARLHTLNQTMGARPVPRRAFPPRRRWRSRRAPTGSLTATTRFPAAGCAVP